MSDHPLSLNRGTLYPALVRLKHKGLINGAWGRTESNREARFYRITKSGQAELKRQAEKWHYALIPFTLTRRTREIGIRTASARPQTASSRRCSRVRSSRSASASSWAVSRARR